MFHMKLFKRKSIRIKNTLPISEDELKKLDNVTTKLVQALFLSIIIFLLSGATWFAYWTITSIIN